MNRWKSLTADRIRELATDECVAILPVGAIEQHGSHLPTGTDSLCAEHLVDDAVASLDDPDRAIVLPSFSYGYSHDHHDFPGTISLPHRVMEDVVAAVAIDVLASGFRRILIVNGHGSNDRLLYYAIRTVRERSPVAHLAVGVTYWKAAGSQISQHRATTHGGMGHAGELETSLMLHYVPDMVEMSEARTEIPTAYTTWRGGDLLDGGTAMVAERFSDRTTSGVVGDPTAAKADTGAKFAAAIAGRLAELIIELPGWPLVTPPNREWRHSS